MNDELLAPMAQGVGAQYVPPASPVYNRDPMQGMSAGQAYAALTREMWANYITNFVPYENKLIEYATSPAVVSQAMSDASGFVNAQFDAQQGATERRMRGLGLQLDPDERRAATQSMALSRSLADVTAQNTARDRTMERQRSVIGNPAPGLPGMN